MIALYARDRDNGRDFDGEEDIRRLSRTPQKFLVHDPEFFSSPMWADNRYIRVITKKDRLYKTWKKSVPAMKNDAVQLSTEAGIDILLYWDGRWRLFWPDEEP